jgi:hypothetical protein
MPVDPNPKSRLDRCGWRLVVRVLEDTDGVEEQLAFERGYDGNTDLEVSRADGDPLRVQLEQLYAAHQGLTVDEAASRIRLSRVHLDGRRVKKVSLWSEKLARASVPTAIRMDFFLHGTVYRAWSFGGLASSAGDMNYWTLAFMGPGPQARKQPNRFIDVVEEIRRGVEKLDWQKAKADKK